MENQFMNAMNFRHACKLFDDKKTISEETMTTIMEAGRLSPSSFGIEPWKFLVITNPTLKEKLRVVCWDQPQVTSCSHLVIILAAINDARVESGTVKKRFERWGMLEETLNFYLDLYGNHLKETLSNEKNIYAWTSKQTYIAAANMMTAAAYMGVDSCPIEGFEKEKVEEILELDTTQWQLALVLPFGYRVNEQQAKSRLTLGEVVAYLQ